MRDWITVLCFVATLTGLGMAERFYIKWKTYVACSQVNLFVAQGQLDKTLDFIKTNGDLLHVDTIDDAVDLCRDEKS